MASTASTPPPPPDARPAPDARRRRRAWARSVIPATIAAFAGGVAVFALQYGLSQVSAGYPPQVQALLCAPEGEQPAVNLALAEQSGAVLPMIEIGAGTTVQCRLEAPGADYATWIAVGPRSGIRSGPLDAGLPCQTPEDFAAQSTAQLRLSACQRARFDKPGLYMIAVTVTARGHPSIDRSTLAVRVAAPPLPAAAPAPTVALAPAEPAAAPIAAAPGATPEPAAAPPPAPAPEPARPATTRVVASFSLPARDVVVDRRTELSADFSEHGMLPQSRGFVRTVYQLAPGEEYVSSSFRARSASNASAVKLAYVAKSRTVTAGFTLRSGPILDRWRGWVSGTAVVRVRRHQEAREVTLDEASLEIPGRATLKLPGGIETEGIRIRLREAATGSTAELDPGGSATLDRAVITARIDEDELELEAAPTERAPH